MATIDKDLLLDKIDRLLKLHSYAREDWFANTIHNTVWDAPEIETDGDLISRADAIEAVKDTMKRLVDDEPKGDSDTFTEYCGKLAKLTSINVEILKELSALPSADADRPKVVGIDYSPYRVQTTAPSAEAVSMEDAMQIQNTILFKEYLRGRRDTEAVQGEWILECDSEGEGDNLYRCSECGSRYGCQEYDKPNFCPNCGARMKGDNDEER